MDKQTKSSEFWGNFSEWIGYWRLNIHRFVLEYLGIKIYPFQQLALYLMDAPFENKITSFIFFASRGLGKSFLTMLYCISKCILYPGIQIKVASSSVGQAAEFMKKIYEIKELSPMIEKELSSISISTDKGLIEFVNKASIEAVVCSDNARGRRANILIMDESNQMNEKIINKTLVPFLTKNNRGQRWASNPKYRNEVLREHNSKIYLTSIGYKDEWSYRDFESYCKFISEGIDGYFALSLPYQFGVEHDIILKSFITTSLRENTSAIADFSQEYEVIPSGESETAMFKFDELNSTRTLHVPLVAPTDDEFLEVRGNCRQLPYYKPKDRSEIRVAVMDVAVSGGRKNDLSVIMIFRCFENIEYYDKEISYIEVMDGKNLDEQVLRLKQVFYDLECDYCVIDAGGAIGIQAVNECGKITKDHIRGKRYPGWKTMNKVDKFDMRIADINAEPVLYPIQVSGAGAPQLQYNMLVVSQLNFQRGQISMLVSEEEIIDELNKLYKYTLLKTSQNPFDKNRADNLICSFANTTELISEAIKTKITKTPSGKFTFDEGKGRKDRVITMLYGLYFIDLLEEDLIQLNRRVDISQYVGNNNLNKKVSVNPFSSNISRLGGFGSKR